MKLFRKIMFWLHLITGCLAGLLIAMLCLTGAILEFQSKINNALKPTVVVPQSGTATRVSLDATLKSLKESGQGTPFEFVVNNGADQPITAQWGHMKSLYIDPYTGGLLPQKTAGVMQSIMYFSENLHISLGAGKGSKVGRFFVDSATFITLILLITGIYLWFPQIFTKVGFKARGLFKRGLKGKARDFNWHNVIGIWTVIPMLVIVYTGLCWPYRWANNTVYYALGSKPPVRGPGGGGHGAPAAPRIAAAPAGAAAAAGTSAPAGSQRPAREQSAKPASNQPGAQTSGNSATNAGSVQPAEPTPGQPGGRGDGMGREPGAAGDLMAGGERGGRGDGMGRGDGTGRGPGGRGDGSRGPGAGQPAPATETAALPSATPATPTSTEKPKSASPAATAKSNAGKAPKQTAQASPAPATTEAAPAQLSYDQLAAAVENLTPDWSNFQLPIIRDGVSTEPEEVMIFAKLGPLSGGPEGMTRVMLDYHTGKAVSVTPFRDRDLALKLHAWMLSFHTLQEFGFFGQLIGFLTCVGGLFVVWTGYALSIRRYINYRNQKKRRKLAAQA